MNASDATLRECLDLLRGEWREFGDHFLNGKYSLWIGSQVSRERNPDLSGLLKGLLTALYGRIDEEPYKKCLIEILGLADCKTHDLSHPPKTWNDLQSILDRLVNKYATVLDVTVSGKPDDFIPWELLKLPEEYSKTGVEPDADHRFIALLIDERVVQEVVTANWDPLIEDAYLGCPPDRDKKEKISLFTTGSGVFDTKPIVVYKIHGCARHMHEEPKEHRQWLVATASQIRDWIDDERWEPLRSRLKDLIRQRRALFVGLSGQDENIQLLFKRAVGPLVAENGFPRDRVVFAKPDLDPPQKGILKALNKDNNGDYGTNADDIDRRAALPLYSKPLLGSLFVYCLLEKIRVFYEIAPEVERSPDRDQTVDEGLQAFQELLINRYDGIADVNDRWRSLARELPRAVSRFLRLFNSGELPDEQSWDYRPVRPDNLEAIRNDAELPGYGFHRLVLLLAALQSGSTEGYWRLAPAQGWDASFGQLVLGRDFQDLKLHVILNSAVGAHELFRKKIVDWGQPEGCLIVYVRGSGFKHKQSAAIGRKLPGTVPSEPTEIWIEDLLADNTNRSFQELLEKELP